MKKILLILLALAVVGGGVAAGIILTRGPAGGSLPTWSEGNQWVYDVEIASDGTYNGTLTQTVTGQEMIDAVDCYTLNSTFDPTYMMITTFQEWVEKDTLMDKEREGSWTNVNDTFTLVTKYSYEFDKALWPLEVGKEVAMTCNENDTEYVDTTWLYTDNWTINGTMKVEGKEKVTVTAGEFDCFKIVIRDEDGKTVSAMWYADKVKNFVKTVDYDENGDPVERLELKSYSV